MGLRTISQEELKEILEQHKLWLETRFCDAVKGKQADLSYANLYNANLDNANLDENEQIRKGYILKDDFIAYKKCRENLIVKLCIPKGSIVFSINNGKCRTNRAKVLDITNISLKKHFKEAISMWSDKFVYKVGDELEIDDFNLMYNVECGSGIHFFRTLEEAKQYRG